MSIPSPPAVGQSAGSQDVLNRRATVRYLCAPATPGRLLFSDKQEWQRGWLLNLSQGGAGMLLAREVSAGLHVVLQVKGPSDQRTYELPARVAHTSARAEGEWFVGLELVHRLTEDELDALL